MKFFAAILLSVLAFSTYADPGPRVGRVSVIEGDVRFAHEARESAPAAVNTPVVSGDEVRTAHASRAEVEVGSTTFVLGENSRLHFTGLNDEVARAYLVEGTLVARLRDAGSFQLSTPRFTVSFPRPGLYRLNVDGEASEIVVREGEAEVARSTGEEFTVAASQSARVTAAGERHMVAAAGERDKLDEWAEAQLKAEEESVSAQYLSPEVTGYQALDEYGDWEETVEYGPVWIPHAAYRGWAPYRYGYWSHAYPWGPVWIDHYPWGFAPFHYGRWAYWNSVWCWVPGHFARSHFHDFHRPKVRDHVHPHVVGKKGVAVKSPRQAPPAVRKKGVAVKSPQQAAPAVNAPQPGRTIGQTPRVTRPAPQRQAPPAVNAPHAGRTIGQTPGVTSPAPQHPVHTGRPIGQKPGVTPPAPGTVGLPQSAPPPPFAKRGLPSSPPPAAPLGRLGLGASGPVAKPGFAAGRGPSASGGGGMRVNGR